MSKHYVYKYVLNNEIIYIGKTDNDLQNRLNQHGRSGDNIAEEGWDDINSSDIYFCTLANSTMCDVVESELIRRYKPKYNKAKMSQWNGLGFVEPQWTLFQDKKDRNKDKKIANLKMVIRAQDKQIDDLKNSLEHKCVFCTIRAQYDYYLSGEFSKSDNFEKESTKTFEEILELYKKDKASTFSYMSETFDKYGNLTCRKTIFKNSYGFLEYNFWQRGVVAGDKNGCIYLSPNDNHMKNWDTLRQ